MSMDGMRKTKCAGQEAKHAPWRVPGQVAWVVEPHGVVLIHLANGRRRDLSYPAGREDYFLPAKLTGNEIDSAYIFAYGACKPLLQLLYLHAHRADYANHLFLSYLYKKSVF